jgi:hypothetical protein
VAINDYLMRAGDDAEDWSWPPGERYDSLTFRGAWVMTRYLTTEQAPLTTRGRSVRAEAYPGVLTKAVAMLRSLVANHPLVDGNKRLV